MLIRGLWILLFMELKILLCFPTSLHSQNLQEFVVFGARSVDIERDTTIVSGKVGSNGRVNADRNTQLSDDVFGNSIKLDRDSIVTGDIHFNRVKKERGVLVKGREISPLEIPVITLPTIPPFTTGTNTLNVPQNSSATIPSGDFQRIEIGRGSAVSFSGGIYNTRVLRIHREAKVSFSAAATINVEQELTIERNSSIASAVVGASQVVINFIGTKTVVVGRNTVLYTRLFAPNARVVLERDGDYRGRIAGAEVLIERNGKVSADDASVKPDDLATFVTDLDGASFPVNQILLSLTADATREDALAIADFIGGTIVGFIPVANLYQIEVPNNTINELKIQIDILRNSGNPKIEGVLENFALNLNSVTTDLANLRRQNPALTQAYDKIKVQDAWNMIALVNAPQQKVQIGVIDTGIDATHREFLGVDLGSLSRSALSDFDSTGGHGTRVAGIIGANNLSAISNLQPNSPQMNGILSGTLSPNLYALEIKPTLKTNLSLAASIISALGKGASILNFSFGAPRCDQQPLSAKLSGDDCIPSASFSTYKDNFEKIFTGYPDRLFVVGAGNDGIDVSFALPAGVASPNVLTVAATNLDDKRANFFSLQCLGFGSSNFGGGVELGAPGVGIYTPKVGDTYGTSFCGTSGAAPMVTGVAGLLKSLRPELTASEIKRILIESANPIQTGEADKRIGTRCYNNPGDPTNTGCRLNALRAVYSLLAYKFKIDNFRVVKNGSLFFEDNFSDALPPPSAPNFINGGPASYFVTGTFGPEMGGRLVIDSARAVVVGSVEQPEPGDIFLVHRARLQSNIDPDDLTRGLKIDDTFSVTGVFDLLIPDGIVESYGISLTDRTSTNEGNDDLRLLVRRVSGNAARVEFVRADPSTDTFVFLATTLLNPAHSQIALTLSRPTTSSNSITASFAYIDGGVQGPTTTFAATANIFRSETFTRPLFLAEERLP